MNTPMKKYYLLSEEKLNAMIDREVLERAEEIRREYEESLLLKQTSLAALQAQINPHFLYNALECIRGQAAIEGSDRIVSIAKALSNFFRYSINSKNDVVSLKDELKHIENYMVIQNFRFPNRFTVDIQDNGCEEYLQLIRLPKLIFQPIMENAVVHGLQDVLVGARITIKLEKTGEQMLITISDNGCGMDGDQLTAISSRIHGGDISPAGEVGTAHTGIALENVNKRLKLFFGEQYGINVYSCKDIGTDVELFIPIRSSEEYYA